MPLGTYTRADPIVANGLVWIGTRWLPTEEPGGGGGGGGGGAPKPAAPKPAAPKPKPSYEEIRKMKLEKMQEEGEWLDNYGTIK